MTGAGGFIGSAVCRAAEARPGLAVTPLSRGTDPAALGAELSGAEQPAIVLHMAWPDLRGASSTATSPVPDDGAWPRFQAWTLSLASAAAKGGAFFVGIGTGIEAYLDREQALGPAYASYARRKQSLRLALEGASGDERLGWLRLHFVFGPGEAPARFVPAALEACRTGGELRCGSVERRRHWLHVDDLAALLCDYLQQPRPGSWDLTGRTAISFDALLTLIEEATGRPARRADDVLPTADAGLALVEPQHLWPGVPPEAGAPDQLRARLAAYGRHLAARGGDC